MNSTSNISEDWSMEDTANDIREILHNSGMPNDDHLVFMFIQLLKNITEIGLTINEDRVERIPEIISEEIHETTRVLLHKFIGDLKTCRDNHPKVE